MSRERLEVTQDAQIGSGRQLPFVLVWGFRVLFLNFLGFFGLVLIAYEIGARLSMSRWVALDDVAPFMASALTVLGALCTVLSVYFYNEHPKPPEKISIYFTGWVAALGCAAALVYLFATGSLPSNIVNGFALLAIAGGLLRIQPNPISDTRVYWKRSRH